MPEKSIQTTAEKQRSKTKGVDCYFVFPPISISERYSREVSNTEGHLPPLGLLMLAAFLEKHGFTAKVLDGPISGMNTREVAEEIIRENPFLVSISSITATFNRAVDVANRVKAANPDLVIITGGHHATISPQEVMKEKSFDLIATNEGEETFIEVMKALKEDPRLLNKPEKLRKIKGIYFRDGSTIVKTEHREPIQNLDELPFAAWHLVDLKNYKPLPNQYKQLPAANFVAIRGCPYVCTFCSNPAIFGHKIRAMSPQRVVAELKHLKETYGIKEISFWDDIFTINRDWATQFCDLMVEKNLGITWSCYARVNTVDPELLKKMKAAGCWNIFFGLEAGDQQLLNNIKKGTTLEQIKKAVKWVHDAGIESRGSFILGLPGETPELAKKTIAFAKSLDLDYAQFCINTPFPGTELYATAEKWGTLNKNNFDEYNIWNPVFVPFGYKDAKELKDMEKFAMKSFYLNPKYVLRRTLKIRGWTDVKRNWEGLKLVMGFTK